MNFYKEVKPFIEKYMNRAFRAYDGNGAEIVFPNDDLISWNFDELGNIKSVLLESKNYEVVGTIEQHFKDILSIAELLAESELIYQEHRKKIDQEYIKLIKQLKLSL